MEGAEQSEFIKRPIIRRTLIAATVPLAIAPIVLLRDMGPLPAPSCGTRCGARARGCSSTGPTGRSSRRTSTSPGSLITVVPEGSRTT